MRFLHTADWHLGRIFYGQYLTEDQAHVLEHQFFNILKDENIDGILLAGDIFDRAVPPIEAIELWDSIITRLAMDYKVPLFVVSGNHDGAERLEVGRSMLGQSGIHIWGSPHHALKPFEFEGSDGMVAICPMPFSEPRRIGEALGLSSANTVLATVQNLESVETKTKAKSKRFKSKKSSQDIIEGSLFADVEATNGESIDTEIADIVTQCYEQNCESALNLHNYDQMYQVWSDYLYKQVPKGMRRIAISHAFVMGGEVGGSERTLSVGGSEQVHPQVFKDFHYTALGHLHKPQRIGSDHIRYSGSLLTYSFDEVGYSKSFTIVDMDSKGGTTISEIPIVGRRQFVSLTGYFNDLLANESLHTQHHNDYVEIRLLDTAPVVDGMRRLRKVFPYCMRLELVGRMEVVRDTTGAKRFKELNERDLFAQFAKEARNEELSQEELDYMEGLWHRVLREEEI